MFHNPIRKHWLLVALVCDLRGPMIVFIVPKIFRLFFCSSVPANFQSSHKTSAEFVELQILTLHNWSQRPNLVLRIFNYTQHQIMGLFSIIAIGRPDVSQFLTIRVTLIFLIILLTTLWLTLGILQTSRWLRILSSLPKVIKM